MSAGDTIKEAVRIVKTSSPAKELMAPLQAKLTLLAEQVAALETENAALRNENRSLKTQHANARTSGEELSRKTEEILKAAFDRTGEFSVQDIMNLFHLKQSVADYHLDTLRKKKFVKSQGTGFMGTGYMGNNPTYIITAAGREHVLKNLSGG